MPHPESISDHVAALEGAVEQISGQFLQQSSSRSEADILNGPPVLLHTLHDLWKIIHNQNTALLMNSYYNHQCMCPHLLQCIDINSVSLNDSDVRRENLESFRVLLWRKLLTQNLQHLVTDKEERREEVVQRGEG